MPYEAKATANYLLDLAKAQGKQIDPMQMQKLTYFAHGWCLGLENAPLVTERIEAWRYGPVIRELYSAFRDVGSRAITHPAYDVLFRDDEFVFNAPSIDDEEEDGQVDREFARRLLDEIWKVYGGFSGIQLSNLTHEPGTPWYETWHSSNKRNAVISDELMSKYFRAQAERA
jgi:uncharacterized phage-associated protein